MVKNKKAQGLSLNFLIVAILAVIALILVALYFTGGLGKIFQQQKEVFEMSSQEKALAVSICQTACSTKSKSAYEKPSFPQKFTDAGITSCAHSEIMDKSYDDACLSCSGTATTGTPCAQRSKSECNKDGCTWN